MGALESYPRITPFLWFDSNAEEAVEFYLSIFKNSRRLDKMVASEDGPVPKGKTLTIAFKPRWTEIYGPERRSAFPLHGSDLVHGSLRYPGGSRRILVEAFSRRKRRPVLLAEGQVRPFLADCAGTVAAVDQASESIPSHAADAEAGSGGVGESRKRGLREKWRKSMESTISENIPVTQSIRLTTGQARTGWGVSGAVAAFMLFDAIGKLIKPVPVVEAFARTGWPVELSVPLGVMLLTCTMFYVIRRTSVLGAILLTGYLGGAVATNLRLENPIFTAHAVPCVFRRADMVRTMVEGAAA